MLRISDILFGCPSAARWLVMTEVDAASCGGSNLLSLRGLGNCLGTAKAKDLTQRVQRKAEETEKDRRESLSPRCREMGESSFAAFRMTMLVASSFFYHFDVAGDGYAVADHLVAAGEGVGHEDHAEILAIDFGGGGRAAAGAHGLNGFGGAADVEGHFFGDAVEGEVAGHFCGAFAGADNSCGLEGDGGKFGCVQEMIAFEVVVAMLHAGVEGGDVDGGGDGGFRDVLIVEFDRAGYFGEFALDVGDAEVADGELGVGVRGVQLPGGGLGVGGGGG